MGEGEESPEREGDKPKSREVRAHIIARHFENLDLPPIALGRSGLGVGKAHPEISVGGGIDRALPAVACADRGWQSFGGLEIDDQAMGREAPIDEADHRNGDIVQADFDLALIAIGIGQAILPKLGEGAAQVLSVFLARQFLAFFLAARIGIERGFAVEGAFGSAMQASTGSAGSCRPTLTPASTALPRAAGMPEGERRPSRRSMIQSAGSAAQRLRDEADR